MAEERSSITAEVIRAVASLMTAAFAFVAGLAWNQAIQDAVKQYLGPGSSLAGEFIYAVIITIIAVIAVVLIGRALGRLNIKFQSKGP